MSLLVAIVIGLVAIAVFFKLLFGVIGIALGLAVGVGAYFVAEKLIGAGR